MGLIVCRELQLLYVTNRPVDSQNIRFELKVEQGVPKSTKITKIVHHRVEFVSY